MKLSVATIFLAGNVNGFSSSSPFAGSSVNDPYAPLLDRLASSPSAIVSTTSSSSNIDSGVADTQKQLLDALSSTLEAASTAARASADVSKIGVQLRSTSLPASNVADTIDTSTVSTFMADAQVKLSAIESQLESIRTTPSSGSDVDLTQVMTALYNVLDTSVQAADAAAQSSSALVDSLVHFNIALSHSMNIDIGALPPPETLELLRAQVANLVDGTAYSFSGAGGIDWSDARVQSFMNDLDRQLDSFGGPLSLETTALLAVSFLLGYFQGAGVEEYKSNIRMLMQDGKFDVDEVS